MNHSSKWKSSDIGGMCWVSDAAQAYIEATVKSVDGKIVKAETSDGRGYEIDIELPLLPPSRTQKVPPRRLLPRVPLTEPNGIENMDNLQVLHEASILENIERRFRLDMIYTNTGPILIAMNPYKWLPIYGEEVITRFHGKAYGSMPPHVFQEAEDAFVQLQKHRKNQAIVICGESGAGKTESTKLMLHYLATVSKRTSEREQKLRDASNITSPSSSRGAQETIAERMVNSNPLLEAYGNAKTLRNDNSSRFGKFTRFDFGVGSPVITGGFIENFLLEKVRVVEQGQGERNYHIFYQMCAAAKKSSSLLADAHIPTLKDASLRNYTNKSGCIEVENVDDYEEFEATVSAIKALLGNECEAEMRNIFRVTAAVYRLGDVEFESHEHSDHHDAAKVTKESESVALTEVTALLQLTKHKQAAHALAEALCTRVREVGGEKVVSRNEPSQAASLRDALAKSIYAKTFDWLVMRANQAFDRSSGSATQFIGVLDIYGFEIMRTNGFEQVFINTTNEQLQKVFNDIIFKAEAEEYAREEIEWDKTAFPDNTPCIELLTKKPSGILRMLDAECMRGNAASDGAKFVAKLNKEHVHHPFYEVCGPASVWRRTTGDRTQHEDFQIIHFAGPVVYTVSQFIDKNRDALYGHVYELLAGHSSCDIIADCFPTTAPLTASSGSIADAAPGKGSSRTASSKQTVSNKYLGQLSALVQVLKESSTRFVRCIKTNQEKQPAKLDKPSVLQQLVCSGVMAALEVRRAGYPTRLPYREFVREFRAFTPKRCSQNLSNDRDLSLRMMQHPHVAERIKSSAYRLGISKLFLQAEVLYELYNIKNNMLYPFVRRLQRWWVHLQGSILQRKFKRCAADLAECSTEASIKTVSHIKAVESILRRGESIKSEAWTVVCNGATGDAVAAIIKFRALCDQAKQLVADAVKRKEEAYRLRATFLAEIDSGVERCASLKNVANTLYDSKDTKSLLGMTRRCEDKLTDCRTELLTLGNEWEMATFESERNHGPRSLQRAGTLNMHKQRSSLENVLREEAEDEAGKKQLSFEEATAARRKRLDEVLTLVREAEIASQAMLEKKRAMDEARREYQTALDNTADQLATIRVDEFIIAGITVVSDAVADAREAIYAAQKALQSIDPDPVKAAVETAANAVQNAAIVAERETARVAAMATLDEASKTVREIVHAARAAGFENRHFEGLVENAEKSITEARDAVLSPDINVLKTKTHSAVAAVDGCGEYLQREEEKQRAEIQARVGGAFAFFHKRDSINRGDASSRAAANPTSDRPRTAPRRVQVVLESSITSQQPSKQFIRDRQPVNAAAAAKAALQDQDNGLPSTEADDNNDLSSRPRANVAPIAATAPAAAASVVPPPPPAPPVTTVDSDSSLVDWLASKNLGQYADQIGEFAEHVDDLIGVTESDFTEIVQACNMKKLTARRLRNVLIEIGAELKA